MNYVMFALVEVVAFIAIAILMVRELVSLLKDVFSR